MILSIVNIIRRVGLASLLSLSRLRYIPPVLRDRVIFVRRGVRIVDRVAVALRRLNGIKLLPLPSDLKASTDNPIFVR